MKQTCTQCGGIYEDNRAVNEMKAALAIGQQSYFLDGTSLPKDGAEQLARNFCSVSCGLAFALDEVKDLYA